MNTCITPRRRTDGLHIALTAVAAVHRDKNAEYSVNHNSVGRSLLGP
jgi:hypothetical protein